ncbi:MAG: LacI family DNA-binding transcriptional regulator [Armatimonadetes bacterium]|nr:LacI family DNA-binding transcriptional regulator [Armatimonadota bacterium]
MQSRITIQDVANKAKVSKVTVSYVLNGRDEDARISQETKKRVLDVARELGYRPNAIARMLVKRKSGTIAVIFQYAQYFSRWSQFTNDVMHGVCTASVENDYDLMLHTRASDSPEHELDQITDGRADGALVLRDADDPVVEGLFQRNFPTVLFFTRSYHPDAAFVDADNYAGGRIATQHLVELGHKRIAMVRGSIHSVSSNDRYNGYRDAIETARLKIDPDYVKTVATPDSDTCEIQEMMARPDRPTAIFVWSDDVAYAVMAVCKKLGLRLPEDVSIVGFDSLENSSLCVPQLTSVRQPIAEMAREATEMLVAKLEDRPLRRQQQIFPLTLDVRASTAPFRP